MGIVALALYVLGGFSLVALMQILMQAVAAIPAFAKVKKSIWELRRLKWWRLWLFLCWPLFALGLFFVFVMDDSVKSGDKA